jgi:hypothetical protein
VHPSNTLSAGSLRRGSACRHLSRAADITLSGAAGTAVLPRSPPGGGELSVICWSARRPMSSAT